MAASSEQFGLSSNVPLYTVFEGNEPCFFRTYFSWNMVWLKQQIYFAGLALIENYTKAFSKVETMLV